MDITLIIPAFNEEQKIRADIKAACEFFCEQNLHAEIIIVDDGSQDKTAQAVLNQIKQSQFALLKNSTQIKMHLISHEKNLGKGAAVRTGILASCGRVVIFVDAGNCVPLSDALNAIRQINQGKCDIAIGSRKHKDSRIISKQNFSRQSASWCFNKAAKLLTNISRNLTDTQAGFKCFKGDLVRKLFRDCKTTGFVFDIEILLRAQQINCTISEFPITWKRDPDTRLCLKKHWVQIFKELWALRKLK